MGDNTNDLGELLATARQHLRNNQNEQVIAVCDTALAAAPGDLRFVFMLGMALRRTGENAKARQHLKTMTQAAPNLAAAHHEYGLASLSLGKLRDARKALEEAVALEPELHGAWSTLRDVRAAEGNDLGAAEAYRNALGSSKPAEPIQQALEFFSQGRLGLAEGICRKFLQANPLDVNAIRLLAEIGLRLGMIPDSINLLERCLELAPDFHVARSNLITALARRQRFDVALAQAAQLEKDQPDHLPNMVQTASLLSMAGRYKQAYAKFEEVLQRVPDSAIILTNYGHALRYGGEGRKAVDIYLQAIAADPDAGEAYWSLANLKTFRFSEDQIEDMASRLAALTDDSPDRFHLAFALGKAREDAADYDGSFSSYALGNEIKKRSTGYQARLIQKRVDNALDQCGDNFFAEGGNASAEPIFIVGLPRAGSTLLEQILASHSQVEATAELPFIGQIASELTGRLKPNEPSPYPGLIERLTPKQRRDLGQQYLDRAAVYRTGKSHFIDKLPNNFLHVALIKSLLPNSTIIDARRDPMAAGFATFKQLFAQGQLFSYNLEDIGHYYADYLRLMAHWNQVLPNQVLTVRYEQVVTELEPQVRRLLDFCQLPFEDACVSFHEQKRAVRSASSEQVRQPIYTGALTQWQHYEKHLDPLRKVLTDRGVL